MLMSWHQLKSDFVKSDPQAIVPELVVIPAGEFIMGETADDKFATDTERPAHRVRISEPFALGKYAVTEAEYRRFVTGRSETSSSDLPVVNVSWEDAREYCAWLWAETGKPFRLPTEAEWEYACRAGTRTPFGTGNDIALTHANFLYTESGERIGPGERVSVSQGSPNRFGVWGLHGNVCEWVEDAWHPNYEGAPTDGTAWLSSGDLSQRVIRGGAWDYLPRLLRSAWRDALPPSCRRDNVGFRVALSIEGS
jgi:formylglycine-generating enzyme required for sulfatase activity